MITDGNGKWVVKDRHEEVVGAGVSVRASAGHGRHHLLPQGSPLRRAKSCRSGVKTQAFPELQGLPNPRCLVGTAFWPLQPHKMSGTANRKALYNLQSPLIVM